MKHVQTISTTPAKGQGDIPISSILSAIASILTVIGTVLAEKGT